MTRRDDAKRLMQERILNVADRLFYAKGIGTVGVDTIAAEVGISKRTLYNHFPSKGDLTVAYLERRNQPTVTLDLSPAERILAEFERLEGSFSTSTFRGCPFINAVAETAEPAEAVGDVAMRFKEARRLWFRANLQELDVGDPDGLATQLMLLIDGAAVGALVRQKPSVARAALDAASTLLLSAGVTLGAGSRRRAPAGRRQSHPR